MSPQTFERKLVAILSADVEGYSLLMAEDETATVRTLIDYRESITILIQNHLGRVVDATGDNLLAEFPSVVNALKCAVEIQKTIRTRNADIADGSKMTFRIGINLGDVINEEGRIYGDGVNIAARVQTLAKGGGVCISGPVYDSIGNELGMSWEYLGRHNVKNIPRTIRIYRLCVAPTRVTRPVTRARDGGWMRKLKKAALGFVLLLIIVLIGVEAWNYHMHSGFPPPVGNLAKARPLKIRDTPSIAVLPFVNMSDDPQQEYLSDGITEDIITDLSKISGLSVIARDSVFTYKGKAVKVDQVSRDLGVRYILEGSIRKHDGRVRVTAQLVDASTGGNVWAQRYDRELEDVFDLQDEITQRIVAALEVKVMEVEQERVMRKATANLTAHDFALRGRWYLHHYSKESNTRARQMYVKSIALDSGFAMAYAGLGWTYYEEWTNQWSRDSQSLERAFEMAKKAIALDDSLPDAHRLLGYIYLSKNQYEQAVAEQEEAIKLDPNNADSYASLADVLTWTRRPQRAIGLVKKAMRLNPHYQVQYLFTLGYAYFQTGDYKEAISIEKEALTRNPAFLGSHLVLAEIYGELGRKADARAQVAEVLKISPNYSLEVARQTLPLKDHSQLDRYLAALRKAGLK